MSLENTKASDLINRRNVCTIFANKISLIHLRLYLIFIESVSQGLRNKGVHTPHTHTHHRIQIKWIYIEHEIKCYRKFITRYTKYELNHDHTVDNGHRTSQI